MLLGLRSGAKVAHISEGCKRGLSWSGAAVGGVARGVLAIVLVLVCFELMLWFRGLALKWLMVRRLVLLLTELSSCLGRGQCGVS